MEGLTVAEIAASQSIGLRSVERKLALIRGKWRKELDR
jgi:DNA-directed RNA polymerase specialized sigma24 family protein